MKEPTIKKGDRIVWCGQAGTVMDIDASAQETAIGAVFGWPFAAWVRFDGRGPDDWSCVDAFKCQVLKQGGAL